MVEVGFVVVAKFGFPGDSVKLREREHQDGRVPLLRDLLGRMLLHVPSGDGFRFLDLLRFWVAALRIALVLGNRLLAVVIVGAILA
jgi:hypothetical protein